MSLHTDWAKPLAAQPLQYRSQTRGKGDETGAACSVFSGSKQKANEGGRSWPHTSWVPVTPRKTVGMSEQWAAAGV